MREDSNVEAVYNQLSRIHKQEKDVERNIKSERLIKFICIVKPGFLHYVSIFGSYMAEKVQYR